MLFYAITDKGQKRAINEDFVFASDASVGALPNLFLVADGMSVLPFQMFPAELSASAVNIGTHFPPNRCGDAV